MKAAALGALLAATLVAPAWAAGDRNTLVELKVGSYRPEIDSEFALTDANRQDAPYHRIFGNSSELMFLLVYERKIWDPFGTLSAGLGLGYWSVDGKGFTRTDAETVDETAMSIFPMMIQLSYRLDRFEDQFPVVPMLRLGLDYYAWRITGGDGETADFAAGEPARGGTWGWHYALGVHFLLDFLAPSMAADFDRDAGVNSSYLTIEYHQAQVDDFGSSTSFRLGDSALLFGLALVL